MSRRTRYPNELIAIFADLSYLMFMIIVALITIIVRILTFIINVIIYYASGYKKKSKNGLFKTMFNAGVNGEYKLYRKIKKVIDNNNIILNAYIPSDSSSVENAEIDLIAVTNKYIYCFEMKNYKGTIYGSREDLQWTQYLNRNRKYQFYNPIRQNEGHIKAILKCLDEERNNILPVVVFSNKANIKNATSRGVIKLREVKKYITEYEERSSDVFSNEEVTEFVTKLNQYADVISDVKRQHINDVRGIKR